jgi:hypothetical protein
VVHVTVVNPNPGATTSNAKSLTVEPPIVVTVSPATKTVRDLATASFGAQVANNNNRGVVWSVNGVAGGNATLGTISTAGLYSAPAVTGICDHHRHQRAGRNEVRGFEHGSHNSAESWNQAHLCGCQTFLEQASWGSTPSSIAHLQDLGIDAWITEQMDTSKTPISQYDAPVDDTSNLSTLQEQFFKDAVTGPDQLRQRVAFALGQIAVASEQKLPHYAEMMPYQQMLLNDAFGQGFFDRRYFECGHGSLPRHGEQRCADRKLLAGRELCP